MKYLRTGLVVICALVAIAAGAWGWQAQRRADRLAELAKAAEASALKSPGAIVRETVKPDAAAQRLEDLQTELSRLSKQVAGLQVVGGATWTGERCTFTLPGSAPPAGQAPPASSLTPAGGEPPPRTMTIEPRGVEAAVEGEAGAQALIGHVDLWQVDPPPERMLGRSKFRADVSKYFKVEVPKADVAGSAPRWKAGPFAGVSTHGWLAGGVLEAPGWRVWRIEAEPKILVAAGPGDVMIGAAVTFGFSGRK